MDFVLQPFEHSDKIITDSMKQILGPQKCRKYHHNVRTTLFGDKTDFDTKYGTIMCILQYRTMDVYFVSQQSAL